ncbi:vWA domain-containing protein [Aquisphaera insulae]|uniref:vWA domain-containing protein n=1 Tax=Aquisphaera insulae TaxID=2712864 RepID=UPI0013EDCF77|nr:BatA and WFA domain-containing protein [Aquisphaera insulae]
MFGDALNRFGSLGGAMELTSPLGLARWFVLAGVPVGIIALYFLKLRRRPVVVPSTLLWRKSLEDLHVNSLFQRLRRNLLLFLQLLAVALAMLALVGLRTWGSGGQSQRFVLMIDNSASMAATDTPPSRLDAAKAKARDVVNAMGGDDLAMVISFAETARVVSLYTGDKRALLNRIDSIAPTQSTTSLREALQVAAGLANPSKQIGEGVVATMAPATPKLFIYTDGGFPDVEGFSLGNLEPELVIIGPPPPPHAPAPATPEAAEPEKPKASHPSDNVAIVALQAGTNEERPDVFQLFGRIHNHREVDVETEARLIRHSADRPGAEGDLVDAVALKIPAGSDQAFKFDIPDPGLAEFEVSLPVKDALDVDNRAFAIVGNARKAQVLVVTEGNRYLLDAFTTPTAQAMADIRIASPEEARGDSLRRELRGGRFDMVIYDGFRPDAPPEANALYFGSLPPGAAYDKPRAVEQPVILDWNIGHPLMQYVRDLGLVFVAKASLVDPPPGSTTLIESNKGPLAFTVPREGYTDTVVLFPLLDAGKPNTTWFRNISFPMFLLNGVQGLGNTRDVAGEPSRSPGRPIPLRAEAPGKEITVTSADGKSTERLSRSPQGTYVYNKADRTGLYHARWQPDGLLPFAVNLFDPRESDLATRGLVPDGTPEAQAEKYRIKIGYNPVETTRQVEARKQDWWKTFALVMLAVLLLEWYIYNRRVYV